MPIRAVIFDIGGVLEVTPPTGWEERWAAELRLDPAELLSRLEPIWRLGATGAATLAAVERETADVLGLDETRLDALMSDVWDQYLGTLNEDLAGYFSALRPRYKTGILSNSFVGARERERAAYGFEEMCDLVVYSHEEGQLKPDPRFYRLICERLGVSPREAVFLDDREACVRGAREVGMAAVMFVDNDQALAELETHLAGTLTSEVTQTKPRA
jgi:epoxide hydrolase-like predicted phosphatase